MKILALKKTLEFDGLTLVSITQPIDAAMPEIATLAAPFDGEPEWLLTQVRIPIAHYQQGGLAAGGLRLRPGVAVEATIEVVEIDEIDDDD